MNFNQLNLKPAILRSLLEIGFEEATEIQEKAIPAIMDGKDVTGQSQTGSGKTAAFGLPLLNVIEPHDKRIPQALILAPTRELCLQITTELRKFAKYMEGLRIVPIYGGEPITHQIKDLKAGGDIIVGTPGRVKDHMDRKTLKFKELKYFVLDEADEMLKMGFKEEIESINEDLPEDKQVILFSATMPKVILDLSKSYQNDPLFIKTQSKTLTVNTVTQMVYEVNQSDKIRALVQLIEYYRPSSSMIFCNTKKMVDDLSSSLIAKGFNVASIHGDLKQEMRNIVMNKFRERKISHLVCTDVAARGIDVDGLDIVFNFDVPQEIDYYVHRIGRTGRAGKLGQSVTLITPKQKYVIQTLEKLTKAEIIRQKMPTLQEIQDVRFNHLSQDLLNTLEKEVPQELKNQVGKLIAQGFDPVQLVEALMYQLIGHEIFEETKEVISNQRHASYVHSTHIELDVGKNQNIAAAHLVSAIAESAGISGKDIGKIRIRDKFSHVEVPTEFVNEIVDALNSTMIRGYKVKAFIMGEQQSKKQHHAKSNQKPHSDYNHRRSDGDRGGYKGRNDRKSKHN